MTSSQEESTKQPKDEPKSKQRGERIQKVLSRAGVASRRASEDLIRSGRVTVNGETVTTVGTRVTAKDELRVDGGIVEIAPSFTYVVVHKPEKMVTTLSDPEGRPTVASLIPPDLGRLFPVGRLDYDTEGLLLMTNDGDMANRVAHPKFGVERTYHVKVKGELGKHHPVWRAFRRPIPIGRGQVARVKRAEFVKHRTTKNTWIELVVTEGKNREVRRICQEVGLTVIRLKRVGFGPVTLHGLAKGQYRLLKPFEIAQLRHSK